MAPKILGAAEVCIPSGKPKVAENDPLKIIIY
jgi:hypothetical protein